MKTKFIAILAFAGLTSCSDFLERPPMDEIENNTEFYNSENNIRSTIYGWYDIYFRGYESGWVRSAFYDGTDEAEWCDDFAQQTATFFINIAPSKTSDSEWNFENVRRINLMCDGVVNSSLPQETKEHWYGVARFFRAMEYARLVRLFGDVPYYDHEVLNTDVKELYKPRTPRTEVMDKVMEDLRYAGEKVRVADGEAGLTVNRNVVNAFASRLLLFEGTWQKYHAKNKEQAIKFLKAAKEAAEKIMGNSQFDISDNYKALTTSLSLAGNKEMILYRAYIEGVLMHAEMSFQSEQNDEHASGPSKDLIDSYLTKNGLPIYQTENKEFEGDQKGFEKEMANRDPRLAYNIDTKNLRLQGIYGIFGIGGYFGTRFINESLFNTPAGQSCTNTTDAPIMKLNEVLLNYIEAAAELNTLGAYKLTQDDFNKTINKIRDRKDVNMPHVTLQGNDLAVKGIVINDPNRDKGYGQVAGDYEVPSILWEIRRERRIELVYEGIRFDDLRRWNKLHYADMALNKKVNLGAWIDKEEIVREYNEANPTLEKKLTVDDLKLVLLDREGTKGYIKPINTTSLLRTYKEKDYLYPIPTEQISLYKSKSEQLGDPSIKLEQNPGW